MDFNGQPNMTVISGPFWGVQQRVGQREREKKKTETEPDRQRQSLSTNRLFSKQFVPDGTQQAK